VGQLAAALTGVALLPLGSDDSGRVYWKFPVSPDLFVCTQSLPETALEEFQALLAKEAAEAEAEAVAEAAEAAQAEEEEQQQRQQQETAEMDVADGGDNSTTSAVVDDAAAASVKHERTLPVPKREQETAPVAAASPSPRPDRRLWKRVSETGDIRRIVELLGKSRQEQQLKRALINSLLMERNALALHQAAATAAAAAASAGASAGAGAMVVSDAASADGAAAADAATGAQIAPASGSTKDLTSWLHRSTSAASVGSASAPASAADNTDGATAAAATAGPAKKPVQDIVPAAIILVPTKGQEIKPSYVIDQETVFDEDQAGDSDAEDEDEAESYGNEYFSFAKGRKYVSAWDVFFLFYCCYNFFCYCLFVLFCFIFGATFPFPVEIPSCLFTNFPLCFFCPTRCW
jgi:hypothetical protein